jgi:prepilin-type N-terminal cleavage/methylation domain-containing protein/prepilin-type processing-associated H-X9-DG protein
MKRAFTLVEMLVVISVIGILAALLFSVLSNAKAQAKRTIYLNNLRQVNLGMRMYCDDSNDTSPTTGHARFGTQAWSGYRELMKTYVGVNGQSSPNDKIFNCPADTFYLDFKKVHAYLYDTIVVRSNLYKQPLFDYSSYGFNGGTDARSFILGNTPGIGGQKLSLIKNPSKTVLLAEAPAFYPYSWHQPSPTSGAEFVDDGVFIFNDAKNNVGFVDGHVSYIKIYWDTNAPNGAPSDVHGLAMLYNPPAGYDYKWSGD